VFTLILVGDSFMEFPITHKALPRGVIVLFVGVKALEEVVAAITELAQSPRVIKPREVSSSPPIVVLLGVST
jgi:hypothetical protein